LREHLRAAAPFGRLADKVLSILESEAEWTSLRAGEQLFAFGDKGDAMYIVADGKLQVFIPGSEGESIVVAEVGVHSIIGEIQILVGGKRTATVRALTPSRLIKLKKAGFDLLGEAEPDALAVFDALILRRLRRNQLAVILTQYFGTLPPAQVEEIESMGEWLQLEQGEILFRQGDRIESFYVVVTGNLGVLVPDSIANEKPAERIRSGGMAGEMALLSDEPADTTVYAIREAELVRFPKLRFFPLLKKHPQFLLHLARVGMKRFSEAFHSHAPEAVTTIISLIPSSNASLPEFARLLAEELGNYSSVLHLNSGNIEGILEMPGISQAPKVSPQSARFSAWLSAQEGNYGFILFEADAAETNWTKRCISQSDQVITVGLASGSPLLDPIEAALYKDHHIGGVSKRLVLIHPKGGSQPSGTGEWLERRRVVMHHHMRLGNPGDFRRLARFLSGSAICLALGGGGARCFAHIGALRALREAGIPIDIVGGTSMGAVIGAELAFGIPEEKMIEVNKGLFGNLGLLLDLTLPLLSFTTGKAYARTLRAVFGEIAMEDLWIPFFCVSSNISRAVMAVHRTGLLRTKLRASSGVQGLFPPVVMNGELHVDGALFSNLPADVMKSVCAGKVIAIDVTPPVDLAENTDYGDTISGWKLLWNRLFSRGKRLQSIDLGTVMQRSAEAASMARQRHVIENMTDLYLLMPVHQISLMNFGAIAKLSEIGYSTAKQKIAEWRKAGKLAD